MSELRAVAEHVRTGLRLAMADAHGRQLVGYAGAFLALTAAAFGIAGWSSALVLQLNGFVLLQHFLVAAAVISGRVVTVPSVAAAAAESYSFGLLRLEPLILLAAGCVTLSACLTCSVEAFHRLVEDHDVHPVLVELVCVAHMAVVVLFSLGMRREAWARARSRGPRAAAWYWLQALQSPLMCIASTNACVLLGDARIDVVCAMALAVSLGGAAVEQIGDVAPLLLQRAPVALRPSLDKAVRAASVVEGVLESRQASFWTLVDGHVVGTLKLRVSPAIDEQQVLRQVRRVMAASVTHCTIELERATGLSALSPMPGVRAHLMGGARQSPLLPAMPSPPSGYSPSDASSYEPSPVPPPSSAELFPAPPGVPHTAPPAAVASFPEAPESPLPMPPPPMPLPPHASHQQS
jgi:Co/Zn/Cd efflux system component